MRRSKSTTNSSQLRKVNMRKVLDKIMKVLAGASLLVMFLLVVWQVFTRYILNEPSTWSEELVAYLFAWSTLFGASLVVSEKGHMNIPVLVEKRSPQVQKVLTIFSELMLLVFSITVLTMGGLAITKLALGQMTSSLGVPVGYFYIPLPITGLINIIYTLLNITDILKGKVKFVRAKSTEEIASNMANDTEEVAKYEGGNK